MLNSLPADAGASLELRSGVASPSSMSIARKWTLLVLFCLAQFIESFNTSAILIALPSASLSLQMTAEEQAWLIASYQLTFASFLLVSGSISDVHSPKYVFIIGCTLFGALSLVSGFMHKIIPLLIVRALVGIAASTTIPSALHLIVNTFTSDREQAQAVTVFGGMAAIGNVLGLILGALLVQFASWRWVFWIGGVVGLPVAAISIFVIPAQTQGHNNRTARSIDVFGFLIVTAALILFIFGITSGSSLGWSTPDFVAPFVISVILIVIFVVWERRLDPNSAALPSQLWAYPNFLCCVLVSLLPFFFFSMSFYTCTSFWQDVFDWSALSTAIHFLPLGLTIILVIPLATRLPDHFSPKWIIFAGDALLIVGCALLTRATRSDLYWKYSFPGFVLGSFGGTLVSTATNITVFRITPPSKAGTVGAVYSSALNLGTAIGIPIITAIQVGVDGADGSDRFRGRAAAYWFYLAMAAFQGVCVLLFYHSRGVEKGMREAQATLDASAMDEISIAVPGDGDRHTKDS